MLLRIALILAIVVLRPVAAWAEGAGPSLDVASLLKDGGPWGAVTVCCAVIWFLWNRAGSKDEEIKALNKDLITAARAAEKLVGDNALAIQRFDEGARVRAADDAERWSMLKRMNEEFTRIAMLVSNNGEAIGRTERNIDEIERKIRRGDA